MTNKDNDNAHAFVGLFYFTFMFSFIFFIFKICHYPTAHDALVIDFNKLSPYFIFFCSKKVILEKVS